MTSDLEPPVTEAAPFRPMLPPAPASPVRSSINLLRPPSEDMPLGAPSHPAFYPTVDSLRAAAANAPRKRRTFVGWCGLIMITGVGMLLGLVMIGVVIGVVRGINDGSSTSKPPAEWDPRVVEFVSFVERERDLTFDHPVAIEFLPEAEFVAIFDPVELPDGMHVDDESHASEDLTDAAGLSTSYEAGADEAEFSQVSTLGFYDPSSDSIAIRGDELTTDVRLVLVHELTHALQAQKYDLRSNTVNDFQFRAIIEADAMRIEDAYMDTLPEADQTDMIVAHSADESAASALAGVPWSVIDQQQAPYILGPIFLDHIIAEGGTKAVEQVFADVPSSEELVNPAAYGVGVDVPLPLVSAPEGARTIEQSAAWSMYDALVMLDAWLPWRESRNVLDGWAAGSYTTYNQGGRNGPVCFTAAVQFDTVEQAGAYGTAITAWATAAGSSTIPVVDAMTVTFEACPRPVGAAEPPAPTLLPSEALYVERVLVDEIDLTGTSTNGDWYSCVARALLDDPMITSLTWVEAADITPDEQAAIVVAADTARWICGEPPAK